MARVLVVGGVTVDQILVVDQYPVEDEKMRCQAHHRRRGGNAANTAVMLSRLGHDVAWAGNVGDDDLGRWVRADLSRWDVDISLAHQVAGVTPTSYVLRSTASGSRTVVHHRMLPELPASALPGDRLADFDWVHFEGRDAHEIGAMIGEVDAAAPTTRTSLEVEKARPGLEELFPGVDLLLFSKGYIRDRGMTPEQCFTAVHADAPDALLVCAWGGDGAFARDLSGQVHSSPAFPPARVVDTLGAGDVFNAAVLHGLLSGSPLASALDDACMLAAEKCAHEGFGFPMSPDSVA
jgi:ketohexokinase